MSVFYKQWFYRFKRSLAASVLTKPQPKPVVFSGAGAAQDLARTIGQFGLQRLLVVTDAPLVQLGVMDSTLDSLRELGVATTVYDGVLPDPTQQIVDDGLKVLREHKCDAVLSFGGGSSIDAGKVIALAGANNCAAADCLGLKQCKEPALPFFAIPTTAGTGSEGTMIAVISDNETHEKGGVIDPAIIPRAAALDPVLMQGLPAPITAATGVDALTHAIESYIGIWATPETDHYSLAAIRLIFDNLAQACSNGGNLKAREAMALASYYGGLAITNALVGYAHAVSHNLGAKYGIPHGVGNALALPPVLEMLEGVAAGRMASIAVAVGLGEQSEGEQVLARKLIDRVKALNTEIGIAATTDKIRDEDIPDLVNAILVEGGTYPTARYFNRVETEALLRSLQAA
jgi:alcohol dehydrogenase class IV